MFQNKNVNVLYKTLYRQKFCLYKTEIFSQVILP